MSVGIGDSYFRLAGTAKRSWVEWTPALPPRFQPVVKLGTPGMDLLWGPMRALERCDAPGRSNVRTYGRTGEDTHKRYLEFLRGFSRKYFDRLCRESAFTTLYGPSRPPPPRGRDLEVLARLINASRDRELTPASPSLPFVVTFLFFFFRFSAFPPPPPLASPESVSRTRKEALSGVKWWVAVVASGESQEDCIWRTREYQRQAGGREEELHAATHAIDKFCSRGALSRVNERRWAAGGAAVGCSIWNSHGNLADRFLDYFNLRLLYITRRQRVTSRLNILRLDTLSAADNLLALRAQNANPLPPWYICQRDKGITESTGPMTEETFKFVIDEYPQPGVNCVIKRAIWYYIVKSSATSACKVTIWNT